MRQSLRQKGTEWERAGYLSSWEVCRRLPITPRQLQWWDEMGYLKPFIKWPKRLYSPDQFDRLRKMAALRKAGVSLQEIRKWKCLDCSFASVLRVTKPQLIGAILVVPR